MSKIAPETSSWTQKTRLGVLYNLRPKSGATLYFRRSYMIKPRNTSCASTRPAKSVSRSPPSLAMGPPGTEFVGARNSCDCKSLPWGIFSWALITFLGAARIARAGHRLHDALEEVGRCHPPRGLGRGLPPTHHQALHGAHHRLSPRLDGRHGHLPQPAHGRCTREWPHHRAAVGSSGSTLY